MEYSEEEGDISFSQGFFISNPVIIGTIFDSVKNTVSADTVSLGLGWVFYESGQTNMYLQASHVEIDGELDIRQTQDIRTFQVLMPQFIPFPLNTDPTLLSLFEAELELEDDGPEFALGLRSNITDKLELAAEFAYLDFDESVETLTLQAAYNFTDTLALTALAATAEDETSLGLGLRYSF